jgi:hypothetical protein
VAIALGEIPAGPHKLTFSRPPRGARVAPVIPEDDFSRHAPVIHARPENGARFTDVPLLTYCERLKNGHGDFLQYTVMFSNEDGGTSTRALMARWGRTTDIEHVYRIWPATGRTEIQARGHNDVSFTGGYEGKHPLLFVTTHNNMVGPEGEGTVRFRPAPVLIDLSAASREKAMDESPFTYLVASRELEAESKLRPFGTVDGQKISDPRNYLYIEARIANRDSRLAARVRLANEPLWRTSWLGRPDYAIERPGWIRTTIELPPGARANQISEIGFDCLVEPPSRDKPAPVAGECTLFEVSKVFLLSADYKPLPSFWSLSASAYKIPTGETRTWTLR